MDVPNASIVQGWQTVVTTNALVSTDGNKCLENFMNHALAQPTGYRPWPGFRHSYADNGVI